MAAVEQAHVVLAEQAALYSTAGASPNIPMARSTWPAHIDAISTRAATCAHASTKRGMKNISPRSIIAMLRTATLAESVELVTLISRTAAPG